MGILHVFSEIFWNLFVFTWDTSLFFLNIMSPKYKPQHVVPRHAPGFNGQWPDYTAPTETDSRSACPMLNAMANHGILPHDGRNISFRELGAGIRSSFNFAPSFCFFVPKFASNFLHRSYWSGRFDLHELSLHNAIEHDASLTRQDAALVPDQGAPDLTLVADLLAHATGDGGRKMTKADLSRALTKRRVDSRASNPHYTESFFQNMFGSSNSSTMLTIFGGDISDLTPMLTEEKFAPNWQPRVLDHWGLTMAKFNFTVIPVERGVNVKNYRAEEVHPKVQDPIPAPA